MKTRTLLILHVVLLFLFSGPAPAQDQAEPKGLKPAEIESLAKLLHTWWSIDRNAKQYRKKQDAARQAFLSRLEALGKAHGGAAGTSTEDPAWEPLLTMVDSWAEVFSRATAMDKPKRVRSNDKAAYDTMYKGRHIGFEYALLVPKKYTPEKEWPLIISLPPLDVEARDYMKAVWKSKAVNKELLQQFIILVPTLGRKTRPPKKYRRDRLSITGFNKYRIWNIYKPLVAVRRQLNVDANRIFLDGSGKGGKIGIKLGCLRAKDFAGIAARNAKPEDLDLLPNLGPVPLRLHVRKGGVLARAKDKDLRDQILTIAKENELDIKITEYEPLPKGAMHKLKKLGGDPVLEATNAILEEFSKVARDPYPLKVTFFSNNRMFMRGPWFKLTPTDFDLEKGVVPRIQARIDRAKNVIQIDQQNVDSMALYLNDKLVDLDRVLKVIVNGKVLIEEKSDRSLDTMLSYHRGNALDPDVIVTKEIHLKIPDPELEEKEAGEEKSGEDKK